MYTGSVGPSLQQYSGATSSNVSATGSTSRVCTAYAYPMSSTQTWDNTQLQDADTPCTSSTPQLPKRPPPHSHPSCPGRWQCQWVCCSWPPETPKTNTCKLYSCGCCAADLPKHTGCWTPLVVPICNTQLLTSSLVFQLPLGLAALIMQFTDRLQHPRHSTQHSTRPKQQLMNIHSTMGVASHSLKAIRAQVRVFTHCLAQANMLYSSGWQVLTIEPKYSLILH